MRHLQNGNEGIEASFGFQCIGGGALADKSGSEAFQSGIRSKALGNEGYYSGSNETGRDR